MLAELSLFTVWVCASCTERDCICSVYPVLNCKWSLPVWMYLYEQQDFAVFFLCSPNLKPCSHDPSIMYHSLHSQPDDAMRSQNLSLNIHFRCIWRIFHLAPSYHASCDNHYYKSLCKKSPSILSLVTDASYVCDMLLEECWKLFAPYEGRLSYSSFSPQLGIMKHTA